eukprot:TRINITY_DN2151_c0_g2_i1.p1 TRINITY_DN2151_c0_g2~~TRINITY_DN2151_c0_g2_i1.p1  ORF type:complete len:176 (-),score=36.42 TRINITY_DN2151_c0_g2_i1:25-552(-)
MLKRIVKCQPKRRGTRFSLLKPSKFALAKTWVATPISSISYNYRFYCDSKVTEDSQSPSSVFDALKDAKIDTNLNLTDAAVVRISKIKGNLRVMVESGGCNGYQTIISIDDKPPKDYDKVIPVTETANIIVDDISLGLIKGATIDYIEEMFSSRFVVKDNPNATSSCGCDISFSA